MKTPTNKLKTFKIVLSKKGKEIFKGGNIEIMKKPLYKRVIAINKQKAENGFCVIIAKTVGTGNLDFYEIKEVKKMNCRNCNSILDDYETGICFKCEREQESGEAYETCLFCGEKYPDCEIKKHKVDNDEMEWVCDYCAEGENLR